MSTIAILFASTLRIYLSGSGAAGENRNKTEKNIPSAESMRKM